MRTPLLHYARSPCIGRAKSRELECHNEGKPRTRRPRKRAVRRLPLPDRPGTSASVPGWFGRAKWFRDSGARTRLHPPARGCDCSLLVAWKAPAGVLGNALILVANKVRYLMRSWAQGARDSRRVAERGGQRLGNKLSLLVALEDAENILQLEANGNCTVRSTVQ